MQQEVVGFHVVVLGIGPRADVAPVERDVAFGRARVQPERHVHALDFLEVVAFGEAVRQEFLVAVVVLESGDGVVLVELERDDVIGLQHVGKLSGHNGVIAAVRAAGNRGHLVNEQLGTASWAVERAQVVRFRAVPFRVGNIVLDGIARLGMVGFHLRAFRNGRRRGRHGGLFGRTEAIRCRIGDGSRFLLRLAFLDGPLVSLVHHGNTPLFERFVGSEVVSPVSRRLGISFLLLGGIELLDFLRSEQRVAELATQLANRAIEVKPAVAVRALIRSSFSHAVTSKKTCCRWESSYRETAHRASQM